jgi:hypothetical protein
MRLVIEIECNNMHGERIKIGLVLSAKNISNNVSGVT